MFFLYHPTLHAVLHVGTWFEPTQWPVSLVNENTLYVIVLCACNNVQCFIQLDKGPGAIGVGKYMAEPVKLEGGNFELGVGGNPSAPHPLYETMMCVCDECLLYYCSVHLLQSNNLPALRR